jgi:hypothetical protein
MHRTGCPQESTAATPVRNVPCHAVLLPPLSLHGGIFFSTKRKWRRVLQQMVRNLKKVD